MQRDVVWDEAVRVVRGDVRGLVPVREDLTRRWSEPYRGYHDLRHLDEVVAAAGRLRGLGLATYVEIAGGTPSTRSTAGRSMRSRNWRA